MEIQDVPCARERNGTAARVMVEAETDEICNKYVYQVVDVLKAKGHAIEGK